jgi:hypothetical protein
LKKKSSFLKDNFLLMVIVATIGYVVWGRIRPAPQKEITFKAERAEKILDLKQPIEIVNPRRRAEAVAMQRKILFTRLAINSRSFTPQVAGENLQMAFRLEPRPRACKDGDIDLIGKVTGGKGRLLLTLEDDGQTIISHKTLHAAELMSPYVFPISIKETGRTRILKLSLCTDLGQKKCGGLPAFDFEKYSKKMGQGSEFKNSEAGLVFYSYSFGLVKNEVQLFDGTNLASRQNYAKFLKAVGGNERQLDFIDQTLAEQKKLGILPLSVDKNNIVLPLYFNDKSKCTLSMNGRRL